MRFFGETKLEKISRIGFIIALIIFIAAVGSLLYPKLFLQKGEEEGVIGESMSTELADVMSNYPDNIILNAGLNDITIYDADDNPVKLGEFKGKNVILIFWASWCKYCREELNSLQKYKNLLDKYGDVEIVLVDKLDGEKESKQQAIDYLKNNNIPYNTFFDKNLAAYKQLGIKIVPTVLGVNCNGILKFCNPGNLKDSNELEAYIDYLKYGASYSTELFITDHLTNTEGGVRVNFKDTGIQESPSGNDVISESQGIMMEYALLKKDKPLFDKYFGYVKQHMLSNTELASWLIADGDVSSSNSLVDDLRIYKCLWKANELWGSYDDMLKFWKKNIYLYNIQNNHLVDSYDFKKQYKSNRLTLCFADFKSLKLLSDRDTDYESVYNNALETVEDGYISDDFPFYHSWYNYKKKEYEESGLNMAEAVYLILNLAEAGKQKESSINWLKDKVASGGIKARYSTNGEVVKGYNYESTAIYAMVAMIGKEIGDAKMTSDALARMERLRVNDKNSLLNGSFGTNNGDDIYSFDQCMALLAYASSEE
ncbi:MAG: TlpA disulfide reductase family protein [Anaerocolumna sp.]